MSVLIYGQIESDNVAGAAALSIALLVIALIVLLLIGAVQRWGLRHEDVDAGSSACSRSATCRRCCSCRWR